MRVFAILLLAGAAAASAIPEQVQVQSALNAEGAQQLVHDVPLMMRDQAVLTPAIIKAKMLSIYGAPQMSRDLLPQERMGVRSLYDKPFVAFFKPKGENEIKAFFIKSGLRNLPADPEYSFFRDMLLSGGEKVGITLSAIRHLDMPELNMPVRALNLPHDYTLNSVYRFHEVGRLEPWVFFTSKDDLRLGSLDKLVEIGAFHVMPEEVKLARELPMARSLLTRELFDKEYEPIVHLPISRFFETIPAHIAAKKAFIPIEKSGLIPETVSDLGVYAPETARLGAYGLYPEAARFHGISSFPSESSRFYSTLHPAVGAVPSIPARRVIVPSESIPSRNIPLSYI